MSDAIKRLHAKAMRQFHDGGYQWLSHGETLALIDIAEAAHRMRQSVTMGLEREARADMDAALARLAESSTK